MFWLTRVRSHSMAPTLPDGSLALTRRLRPSTPVRRGDLVIVESPRLGRPVVKRIIGLPGETVTIQAGKVSIDGHALAEPYAFLLGDNRDASRDSRTWRDPHVPRDTIVGRILGWPWVRKMQGFTQSFQP